MDCSAYRDEFSALLDGEEQMLAVGVLDAHLARCSGCASWVTSAEQLHRATRVAPAPEVPDLVAPILAAALARMHSEMATEALFEVLGMTNASARSAAATTLVSLGVEGAASAVGKLAQNDPDPEVRRVAAALAAT